MLGPAPHCWAHLAGISGGVKIYLGPSILIKIIPPLSAAIGGQDGMDGSRAYWMTLPFWEVPSIPGSGMLLGSWDWFFIEKKGYITSYSVCNYNSTYYICSGGQEWVDGNGLCRMTLPYLEIPNVVAFG